MQLTLVTPPAGALVSLAEAKMHLRVEHDAEDDYLPTLIASAEALVGGRDGWTGRALLEQTWRLVLPGFPIAPTIRLPFPPLQSVTHVKYYDANNDLQTYAASNYLVQTGDTPGRLDLLATIGWPSAYSRRDAVEVEFVCGYADAASVPAPVKHAALLILAALYRNRGDEGFTMPAAVRRLLAPYKAWGYDDWK